MLMPRTRIRNTRCGHRRSQTQASRVYFGLRVYNHRALRDIPSFRCNLQLRINIRIDCVLPSDKLCPLRDDGRATSGYFI